ncbi:hypothetical protein MED121_01495 [Marinomonas sp. MED121]|uniref:hypothetical protein n=1 Tax=Marinomonas sp. MED121 TaxID=314277 RepID=UPI0000690AA2|nr:hypothetical protein [Marinomonas sp. MED121]EAQ65844.1 hypothetical protein MED121_01495 [Marinomonas sp. MED121]
MQTNNDLTWLQLHDYSSMLLLESPEQILSDGLSLLELLQELGQGRDKNGAILIGLQGVNDQFLNALRISEGLIRMGVEMNNKEDASSC